jgi:hypothetical protein
MEHTNKTNLTDSVIQTKMNGLTVLNKMIFYKNRFQNTITF